VLGALAGFKAADGRSRSASRDAARRHMPFKSQAQRRKFAELLVKGKISGKTFEEWNRETGSAKLPERVKPKVKGKAKTKSKAKSRENP
jgi:hypothetical protein